MEVAIQKVFDRAVSQGAIGIKSRLACDRRIRYERVSLNDAERSFEHIFGGNAADQPDPLIVTRLQHYLKENEAETLMERILHLNGTMLFSRG
jgi:hypothetical protein